MILNYFALFFVYTTLSKEILFDFKQTIKNQFIKEHFHLLYCFKCVSLWGTLILSGNIFTACIVSMLAIITEKILEKI